MTPLTRRGAVAAAALAMTLLATGCTESPEPGPDPDPTSTDAVPDHQFDAADTTITYAFTDSSVPPEHHRSFTLTIVDGVGTLVVDSYGDEMARDEQEVSSAVVDDLLTSYNEGELAGVFGYEPGEGPACEGGRTYALALDDGSGSATIDILQCDGVAEEVTALTSAVEPLLDPFDVADLTEDRYTW